MEIQSSLCDRYPQAGNTTAWTESRSRRAVNWVQIRSCKTAFSDPVIPFRLVFGCCAWQRSQRSGLIALQGSLPVFLRCGINLPTYFSAAAPFQRSGPTEPTEPEPPRYLKTRRQRPLPESPVPHVPPHSSGSATKRQLLSRGSCPGPGVCACMAGPASAQFRIPIAGQVPPGIAIHRQNSWREASVPEMLGPRNPDSVRGLKNEGPL